MSYLADANCGGFGGGGGGGGGGGTVAGSHEDGTPFYQRMFQDGAGDRYFHVIVGDYTADSMALEYIVKEGYSGDGTWDSRMGSTIERSSSAGDPNDRLYNMTKPYDTPDTLSENSGTATGNPTRVIMKQVIQDAEVDMVFIKDQFLQKPFLSQSTTQAGQMVSYWQQDMRGLDYTTDQTPIDKSQAIITQQLLGADKYGSEGDFDYSQDVNWSSVDTSAKQISGGGYTYTEGTGAKAFGGSLGTYTYMDDGTNFTWDAMNEDYSAFCDPLQNSDWSGYGACTNGDGSGGGSSGGRWGGRTFR